MYVICSFYSFYHVICFLFYTFILFMYCISMHYYVEARVMKDVELEDRG